MWSSLPWRCSSRIWAASHNDGLPPVVVFSAVPVSQADRARVAAVLVKAQTSNVELLETLQRVLREATPGGPAPA